MSLRQSRRRNLFISIGKGCIVDSGTTDTYLPSSLAAKFSALFKEVSGS